MGDVIVEKGEIGKAMYFLQTGAAQIENKQKMFAGDAFGESALVKRQKGAQQSGSHMP